MFLLTEKREVFWPVTWDVALDNGKTTPAKIDFKFILISPDDYQPIAEGAAALDETESSVPLSLRKAQLLMPLIADWKGVGDEKGEPVEFCVAALARLFAMSTTVFNAVLESYARCANGIAEHRRKN